MMRFEVQVLGPLTEDDASAVYLYTDETTTVVPTLAGGRRCFFEDKAKAETLLSAGDYTMIDHQIGAP